MSELKGFIKGLVSLGFEMVSIEGELVNVEDLLNRMCSMGIGEVVAQYNESFEIITNDGEYIEICGVC